MYNRVWQLFFFLSDFQVASNKQIDDFSGRGRRDMSKRGSPRKHDDATDREALKAVSINGSSPLREGIRRCRLRMARLTFGSIGKSGTPTLREAVIVICTSRCQRESVRAS